MKLKWGVGVGRRCGGVDRLELGPGGPWDRALAGESHKLYAGVCQRKQ